jgi:GNAT superfamily N-acetyltransferase
MAENRAEVEAFLTQHAEYAMFPLSNLARYGMEGGHDLAIRMWMTKTRNGQIDGVLSVTEAGMVMPCLPADGYAGAAKVLRGQALSGLIGPTRQVRGLEAAAGLTLAPRTLDRDEPHFLANLADLVVPTGPGQIVPMATAPKDMILGWMENYQTEALNTPAGDARAEAEASYVRYVKLASHVVLMHGEVPLAMTGFNATLADIVQIGGVYTPPEHRGRGYARRALALHLGCAQAQGVRRATLFSGSDMATRAYMAIGFHKIGRWTLLLFQGSQVAHG